MGNASVLICNDIGICYPEAFGEHGGTSPVPEPVSAALPRSSLDLALATVLLDRMSYANKFKKYFGWDEPSELDLAARRLGFNDDGELRRGAFFIYVEEVRGSIVMYPTARRGRKAVTFVGVSEMRSPSSSLADVTQTFLAALARCR